MFLWNIKFKILSLSVTLDRSSWLGFVWVYTKYLKLVLAVEEIFLNDKDASADFIIVYGWLAYDILWLPMLVSPQ